MAIQFTVSFSSFLVEDEYLVALYQRRFYFAYHFGSFYGGRTYGDVTVFVYQENAVELYGCAVFGFLHVVNKQFLASLCLELLALDFYNCVHFFMYIV